MSSESITLALTKAELQDGGELNEEDIYIRAQNQVALVVVLEVLPNARQKESSIKLKDPPLLIVSTTHLKSSRSATGERYRKKEINEVMGRIEKIKQAFAKKNRQAAVLLSGRLFIIKRLAFKKTITTHLSFPRQFQCGARDHNICPSYLQSSQIA